MEVVLLKMRISGKRSQDHQEEQQAKILKNSDEEMDTGKMEDEEDDGYQPNIQNAPSGPSFPFLISAAVSRGN